MNVTVRARDFAYVCDRCDSRLRFPGTYHPSHDAALSAWMRSHLAPRLASYAVVVGDSLSYVAYPRHRAGVAVRWPRRRRRD